MADEKRNLSSLGVGQKSQSSDAGGGLSDIMGGDSLLDEVGRSRVLSTQLELAKGSQPRSPLDVLTSPRGIAGLIASIGAIAAGGDARTAGIGGLLGMLTQAQQVQEGERAQKESAIEQITEQFEKSQQRQDKIRTRMAGLFNTNPEAFQGPEGQAPDPQLLGWYLTGSTNFPMWTSTRRNLNMRDKRWSAFTDVLSKGLEEAPDQETARQLTTVMLRHLGMQNPDPDTVQALTNAYGSPDQDTQLWRTYLTTFGISGRDAMLYAYENGGLSPTHPEVLRRLSPKTEVTPSAQLTQTQIDLMDFVRGWETDPVNAERVLAIRRDSKNDDEAQRTIIQESMGSTTTYAGIDAAFLIDKINIEDPGEDMVQLMRILGGVKTQDGLLNTLIDKKLLEVVGKTSEEWNQFQMDTAVDEKAALEQNAKDSELQLDARILNDAAASLSVGIPGHPASAYRRAASKILKDVRAEGITKTREELSAEVKRKVQEAIADKE